MSQCRPTAVDATAVFGRREGCSDGGRERIYWHGRYRSARGGEEDGVKGALGREGGIRDQMYTDGCEVLCSALNLACCVVG